MSSPNPNWPLLWCKVAFNINPNDPAAGTPTWTDLTDRLLDFTVSRGRQYELDQVQAGEFTATLRDSDEQLNPANTASPFYPNVVPYRRLALAAMWPPGNTAAGGPNLLNSSAVAPGPYDPSFESYTAVPSWIVTFATTPNVSSAQAFQGTKSLAWTVTGGSGEQVTGWNLLCVPGEQYTISAYVYQTAGNTTAIFINGGAGGTNTTATTTWTRLSVTFTATSTAHQVYVGSTAPSLSGSMWLDAIQMETGSSASTWSSIGPVIYPIFAGFVERWPSTWNHQGTYGICQITAVDALGVLSQATLDSELSNQIEALAPTYYWPLWEPQGSQAFANTTLAGQPPLSVYTGPFGAGNGLVAGDSALPIPGDNGGVRVTFAPGNNTNASQMDCQILNAGPVGTSGSTGIQAIPANPAVSWSATLIVWAGANLPTDSRKGTTQTLATLVCPPQGSNQAQPLTIGVTGTNVLWQQDPSFEGQSSGATPTYLGSLLIGAMTVTNTQHLYGANSAQFPIGAGSGLQGVLITAFGLTSGQQYTFSCGVRQTAANTMLLGAAADSGIPPASWLANSSGMTSVNTWVTMTVSFTANGTSQNMWVYSSAPANNSTVYIDGMQVEAGPAASAFTTNYGNAFVTYEGPGGQTLTAMETGTNDADGKMRMFVAQVIQDPAGNTTVSLQVDNTQNASATASTASLGGQLPAGASIVQVGGQSTLGLTGQTWNGQVAHVSLWNSALPSGAIGNIYSAGQIGWGPYTFFTEKSGARVSRWLGYVFTGTTAVDAGQSVQDVSPVQRANYALDALNGVVLGEGGLLYADKAGTVTFKARTARFQTATPKWTLGEQETPYEADVAFSEDPTQVYNDITISRVGGQALPAYASSYLNFQSGINSSDNFYGGTVCHVTDGPSMLAYGDRQLTAEVNTASDSETVDHANYLLSRYKQPLRRLDTLTISAGGKPTAWSVVLGMELNDRATVKRRTSAFTDIDDYFIEKLDVSVNFAAGEWDLSVQASPADLQQAWLLNDPVFGVLGSTTKLGW
jgi:hypothetical protein